MRLSFCALFFLLLVWPLVAEAAKAPVKNIGQVKTWQAYRYSENGQAVCYMVQYPAKSGMKRATGDALKRGRPSVMVALRPFESVAPIISFDAGYTFKPGSEAQLDIDGASWRLFTNGGTAWARTSSHDRVIANAMRKGKRLVVIGTSVKGSKSADRFDMAGSERAYRLIAKACGVKD